MARELADVLHYFLDDAPPRAAEKLAPVVAVPLAGGDALRASFVWNLAVELARTGARPLVAVPSGARYADELLPDPPLGGLLAPEVAHVSAEDLGAFAGALRPLRRRARGLALALVPPAWLGGTTGGSELLAWTLVFARPEEDQLDAATALAERAAAAAPFARLGVTLHGVGSVAEARDAFERLAGLARPALRSRLWSYGVLLDDLDVYRGLAQRTAVGLARPQSRAARALADVARLLLDDARAGAHA
ncbi:MAG TPA: hypothetical protein VHQ66_15770 [Myxococcota bacterium]|jgi:hypothetical protein|nr:hypothetical protein [Myxococcota bacterium]